MVGSIRRTAPGRHRARSGAAVDDMFFGWLRRNAHRQGRGDVLERKISQLGNLGSESLGASERRKRVEDRSRFSNLREEGRRTLLEEQTRPRVCRRDSTARGTLIEVTAGDFA